jgi:hypothetical protein
MANISAQMTLQAEGLTHIVEPKWSPDSQFIVTKNNNSAIVFKI